MKQKTVSEKLLPHLCIHPRPAAKPENLVIYEDWRITVLTERLLRIERCELTDEATQTVWFRDFPGAAFRSRREGRFIFLSTAALELKLDTDHPEKSLVRFPGGTAAGLDNAENLMGTCSTLDTNGSHLRENPAVTQYDRNHIPLGMGVCAKNGVAVYDDSASLLLRPDGTLLPRQKGLDWYVFAFGRDYAGAVRALYRLCGETPVLPRWALGNWWSRYWPYTQQEYVNLMDDFAQENIPLSVAVVDMDWHYVHLNEAFGLREKGLDGEEYGGTDGWTGYTWNEALFPNHKELLDDLHRRGMHTTLNLHPALGVRWYEKPYPQMASAMGMDPDGKKVVPFQISDSRFVNNYMKLLHHPLEQEGVDFWWVDWQQGKQSALEGLDPLWALNHYHYLDSAKRNREGLILSRYAGVGSHRYPVGFSGDIHMDWEFLDYMPYFTATAANVGYGWWSHDIGGHHRGVRDEELYLRWLQFGVFSPINRVHCCPAEVTSKEPWTYARPTEVMAREWFRFRHRLVPYLYSASWNNTLEGTPLIRPMYYEYPDEEQAYQADGQYLFGGLLAAPITRPSEELGMAKKRVWLPNGNWTDIFTGGTYSGGRWVTVYRDSGSMPVFAPEGAVVPLDSRVQNDCREPESLDVWVFSGDGSYLLRESRECGILFTAKTAESGMQYLEITGSSRKMQYHVYFRNIRTGNCTLRINGKPAEGKLLRNRCLQILFSMEKGDKAELVAVPEREDGAAALRRRMLDCFIRLPMDNWYKEKMWETIREEKDRAKWLAWISALDISETARGMLEERLSAVAE